MEDAASLETVLAFISALVNSLVNLYTEEAASSGSKAALTQAVLGDINITQLCLGERRVAWKNNQVAHSR